MTGSATFADTVRRGTRAGSDTVVVHLGLATDRSTPAVGVVVSRQVGNAVARNLVKRRLRELARERLASLPGSAAVVLRARPAAASTTYLGLGADLDRALARALARARSQTAQTHQSAGSMTPGGGEA